MVAAAEQRAHVRRARDADAHQLGLESVAGADAAVVTVVAVDVEPAGALQQEVLPCLRWAAEGAAAVPAVR